MPVAPLQRIVYPEILDELAPEDSRALRSRRDLCRINSIMGHARLIANRIRESGAPLPVRVLELGAGDGRFLLSVVKRLGLAGQGGEATLLDRQKLLKPETAAEYQSLGWQVRTVQADVLSWLSLQRWDVIVCNLFLHHFKEADLRQLLDLALLRSDWLIACEPRRSYRALRAARLLWALGANVVTRHDAVVSVRAGFFGSELSSLLADQSLSLREESAGLFSHLFEVRRNPR